MSTKKVPCTAAAAGAPWTSFVSAVDEVVSSYAAGMLEKVTALPGQITPLVQGRWQLCVHVSSCLFRARRPPTHRRLTIGRAGQP